MRPVVGAAAGVLAILTSGAAWADADEHARSAGSELVNVDREIGTVQAAVEKAKGEQLSVEARLANGELLYRTKDYPRAANVFSEILEKYPNTPSYPDALWLRGETYYAAHEYLSARRDYRALVDKGTEPRFQSYFGRALARLVDVSLRVGDIAGLDEVFQKLGQVPPAQVDAGLNYAKGKAYYAKVDYTNAQQAFQGVTAGSDYGHQAKYFLGLIAMKQIQPLTPPPSAVTTQTGQSSTSATPAPPNYKPAVDVFRQVTELPPDTDDHRHVIDLAWMAIGRLFYEMDQYEQASQAYAHVSRGSPEFDTMLYELAWVYVRVGDVQRAERALEVLQVADPLSPYVGDGTLLRADLLLRAGAFDKALQLYEGVRTQYDPMRVKVETFLGSTKDVGVYYEKLSQQQLDTLEQNEALPPLAVRWAREAEDGPAAFAVIDDVNECKTLIKQSNELIEKLSVLTNAANRVRAFPELEAGEERALGLLNQVARARLEIAKGLDDEEKEPVGSELGQVREQRRALMGAVADMPTTSGEFDTRDAQGRQQWNSASQSLTNRNLEIDQLQAIVNGLRRMLRDDAQKGVARDPTSVARFQAELDQNEHDLKVFHDEADELRKQINFGRAQVGLGDARYQNDATTRAQFRDLLDREVQLAVASQAGTRAQSYGQRVQPLLMQGRSEEDKLVVAFAALDAQVDRRTKDLEGTNRSGAREPRQLHRAARHARQRAERRARPRRPRRRAQLRRRSRQAAGDRAPRGRRNHRAGVGSARRRDGSRAQPPDRARARRAAPRRGAA